MDLVAGGVVHGRLPVRPSRFPLLLGSLPYTTVAVSAAFSGCPCPPIVRRNAPAVVPFAKKKRKGYSEDPPDEEVADDFTDELEEDEEVEEEEDFGAEEEEEGNGFCELGDVCFSSYDGWEFPGVFLWDDHGLWTLHFAPFLGSPYLTVHTVMHFLPLKILLVRSILHI
jgi:hypothetical protein